MFLANFLMSVLLEGSSFTVQLYAALTGVLTMQIHTHAVMQVDGNWLFTGEGEWYTVQTEA